jgi:hypothetical protein
MAVNDVIDEIKLKSPEDVQIYVRSLIDRCGDDKGLAKGKMALLKIWNALDERINTGDWHSIHPSPPRRSSKSDRVFIINKFNATCAYCGKKGNEAHDPDGNFWHLDHIIPHSWDYSGGRDNLALSCQKCNMKKGAHWWCPTIPLPARKQTPRGANE